MKPWDAGQLLEEISNNADGYLISRQMRSRIMGNMQARALACGLMTVSDPTTKTLTFTYTITVEAIMKDVDGGTIEEVVEWAKTGVKEGQSIALGTSPNGPAVHITQTVTNPHIFDDYTEEMNKFMGDMFATAARQRDAR